MLININIYNKYIKTENNISILFFLEKNNICKLDDCIAAQINDKIVSLNYILKTDLKIELIKLNDESNIKILNNLLSFFLGYSINKIYPKSKLINLNHNSNSFFYDFYLEKKINNNEIIDIENYIKNLFNNDYLLLSKKIKYNEIKKKNNKNNLLKIKYLNIKNNNYYNVVFYNDYFDILDIPIIENLNLSNKFRLNLFINNIWYDNKINKLVKRISGYIIKNNSNALNKIKYVGNRDHRKINNDINLFYINKNFPGIIFWKENGLLIFNELKKFIQKEISIYNYIEVITPVLMIENIWNKTEHLKYYNDNIFSVISNNKKYCIKPMNCPGHIYIYNSNIRSYKDLPYRISEFGLCHRNELSGSLHGLLRTKSFFQDDGHIFCTKDQIFNEIKNIINITFKIYNIFNLHNIKIKFSTRPKDRIEDDNIWNISENIIIKILKKLNIDFELNIGDGAFYGPKIEFIFLDYCNREWQCGTIQLDLFTLKKFNTYYIDNNNKKNTPILIHRAILGSIERFIGILTEEYYGKFPIWLCPIQVVLISITNKNINYINKISKIISKHNIRYKIDISNKKLEYKIRKNSILNIPYIFICGNLEEKNNTISVRNRNKYNLGTFKIKEIINLIKIKILNKDLNN